ncbi:MAG: Phage portal protein, SPP1 Gp6-like [Chloroflexi bacterium ADurb.Bin180]|nr:MAG: Phage portal protein, SPP1 Gp6-like [Chloroflexi bacterium ADurb.Bin180]
MRRSLHTSVSRLRERVAEAWFGDLIQARVENALKAVDDAFWRPVAGGSPTLDRDWGLRRDDLDDALEAWRANPLARRIVALTTDYVVGSGIAVRSDVEWVQRYVNEFWALNRMDERLYAWCDELTRSGELFVVLRTDPVSGMGFVRAVPAVWIDAVQTDPDDLERELSYHRAPAGGPEGLEGRWWPAASAAAVPGPDEVMLHHAINRPVGCVRGESDLGPLLPWLRRYREWLENRVRLNKFKTAFLWDVTVTGSPGSADALRSKRFRYQTPPEPGSIIVHDDSESWDAVTPRIDAWDAKDDGKALRLMIAAGAGVPLHFMGEGESATRATAAEMGDPTYRHYYRRQLAFGDLLLDLLRTAIRRANARGRGRSLSDYQLRCSFPDITKQDNLELARSAQAIAGALEVYAREGWVDRRTAIEMAMRFAGELVDVERVIERIDQERRERKEDQQ